MILFVVVLFIFSFTFLYLKTNLFKKKESFKETSKVDFIPSDVFKGAKVGYVFKKCSKGLGYYKDKY
jgi:hypothetical protein